jgi:hypothetical protein
MAIRNTWRWTVQVGQATSRICVLDPCGADEFGQGCGGPWFVPAPHDGQQETLPVTNEMLPHLLQFRTEVPDDFEGVLLRLLLSWLLLLSAFLPAFRSSSSWFFKFKFTRPPSSSIYSTYSFHTNCRTHLASSYINCLVWFPQNSSNIPMQTISP